MIAGVADTHAALWYLFGDARLSRSAKTFIDEAADSGRKAGLSVISLAEIIYLIEKNRLPFSAYDKLRRALGAVDYVIEQVSRADVPGMPDRIVAATGVYFGVPVISRDGRIRASNIQTVW